MAAYERQPEPMLAKSQLVSCYSCAMITRVELSAVDLDQVATMWSSHLIIPSVRQPEARLE